MILFVPAEVAKMGWMCKVYRKLQCLVAIVMQNLIHKLKASWILLHPRLVSAHFADGQGPCPV